MKSNWEYTRWFYLWSWNLFAFFGLFGKSPKSAFCFVEEFKDSAMTRVCPGDELLQQQPVGPSQSASVEGRSASRRWIYPDPTVTNVGTAGREVDQRHTQVVWMNSIAVYLVRWVLLSCQLTYKWAMISNEYISSLQIHFTLNSLDDRSYTCNHPTPLFFTLQLPTTISVFAPFIKWQLCKSTKAQREESVESPPWWKHG